MYVHSDSLLKLRCTTCKLYLSFYPIYSTYTGESYCGRCPVNPLDNIMRNELYEAVTEKQKFPCRYQEEGCLEKLTPVEIPDHEEYCPFKKIKCPMLITPACKWTGFTKNLMEHFEMSHPTFVLNNHDFEIDFVNTHHENYLLPHGEDLFILYRSADTKNDTFTCSLKNINGNSCSSNFNFKIVFESNTKLKHEVVEKLNERVHIEGKVLRDLLKDPTSIVAKVDVIRNPNADNNNAADEEYLHEDVNYELLQDLECMVCMHYMIPPIFQCVTGHSICNKCKEEVTECPTCKKPINDTQNFSLASVIQHIEYPCKNSRCRFKGKPKDIKKHEATCAFGEFACPLKDYVNCQARLIYDDLYNHVKNNHYESLVEMETVKLPFDRETGVTDCYIFRHGPKLFRLHFAYDDDDMELRWSMELIGPANEIDRYKFEIDICDMVGGSQRFYFKKPCKAMSSAPLDMTNSYCIEYYQIQEMMSDELCYRVRILEQVK